MTPDQYSGGYVMGDIPTIAECVEFCEEHNDQDTIEGLMQRCIRMAQRKRLISSEIAAAIIGIGVPQISTMARAKKMFAEKKLVRKAHGAARHWEWRVDSRDVRRYAALSPRQRQMFGRGKIDLDGKEI